MRGPIIMRAPQPFDHLAGIRHWLLDVEGTLVLDKDYAPVPGAPAWFAALRARGDALRILTNNTTLTRDELATRLSQAGFPVDPAEIVSCQDRLLGILRERAVTECALLGSNALVSTLAAAGVAVHRINAGASAPAGARVLVLGYLDEVSAPLLGRALEVLQRPDSLLVALHKNRLFVNRGRLEPGLGAWVAALEHASGKAALVAGKPDPSLFAAAASAMGALPAQCAMVGDDPEADLVPARRLGMTAVLVLSGKHRDSAVLESLPKGDRPHLVVPSVAALPPLSGATLRDTIIPPSA
jgi:HAD superfamily hydrolase (TIGR01450 family)